MKKWAAIITVAVLLGALAFVCRKVTKFSGHEHEQFQTALWRLKHLDTTFKEGVLEARFALLDNYDDFQTQEEELTRVVEGLNQTPTFIRPADRHAIEQAREQYAVLAQERKRLFERFKSQNAMLANSRRYLPGALDELAIRLQEENTNQELQDIIGRVTRLTLMRLSSPDELPADAPVRLQQLNQWAASHPQHEESKFVLSVLRHARNIVAGNGELDTLTRQLLALPTDASIEKLFQAYETQVARALRQAQQYRTFLYVLGFISVLGVTYTLWALRVSNRNLEHRVAHRTRSLQLEIREREDAEVALKKSQLRYRSLFENMLEGYAYCRIASEQHPHQPLDFTYLAVNSAFETLTGLTNVVGKKASEAIPGVQEANPELFEIYNRVASTGIPERFETYLKPLGIWFSIAVYSYEKEHFVAIFDNITERKRAETLLMENQQRLALATESAHIGIWDWDVTGNVLAWDAQMFALYGVAKQDFSGAYEAWQQGLHAEDRKRGDDAIHAALEGIKDFHIEFRVVWPSGEVRHIEGSALVQRAGDGSAVRMIGVNWDITKRKRGEADLEKAHQRLLETSHQAGMAEVATSVLHNVGNVLNSVNISSTLVADAVRKSKAVNLAKVVQLLRTNESDMGSFLTNDPKGKQLPQYLAQLADHLAGERTSTLEEIARLQKNIEHIKDIVSKQQSYASVSGVAEIVNVSDLVEDALHLNAGSLVRHDVEAIREFADVPPISIEKHKVLQILVNLISNAKQACDESGRADKRMTVRVTNGEGSIKIAVGDNGVGIPPENLIRIFNHGFTTRKTGHGFGLHSGALSAKQLGGELRVQSDGVGHGATFTLELPLHL